MLGLRVMNVLLVEVLIFGIRNIIIKGEGIQVGKEYKFAGN